eukprot:7781009-Pyramimonas_sp.AAC.1
MGSSSKRGGEQASSKMARPFVARPTARWACSSGETRRPHGPEAREDLWRLPRSISTSRARGGPGGPPDARCPDQVGPEMA